MCNRGQSVHADAAAEAARKLTGTVTDRTDVWAFAVLALHLWTGVPPTRGVTPDHSVDTLPGQLRELFMGCLSSSPAKRPSAAQVHNSLHMMNVAKENVPQFARATEMSVGVPTRAAAPQRAVRVARQPSGGPTVGAGRARPVPAATSAGPAAAAVPTPAPAAAAAADATAAASGGAALTPAGAGGRRRIGAFVAGVPAAAAPNPPARGRFVRLVRNLVGPGDAREPSQELTPYEIARTQLQGEQRVLIRGEPG